MTDCINTVIIDTYAGVAQLVEHRTCNAGVASSNPASSTKHKGIMMATLILQANNTFTIDVSVSGDDGYSDAVQVKIENNFGDDKVHGTDELFLTPNHMELLGRFLIRQADELRNSRMWSEA